MAAFKFPLQTLLRVREQAERDEQIALAQLERERQSMLSMLEATQTQLQQAQRDARGLLDPHAGPLDLPAARLQAHAALHLQARRGQLSVTLRGAETRSAQQRERLLRASIARRALERLRERRLEAGEKDMQRREQAEIDDLATVRAARDTGKGR